MQGSVMPQAYFFSGPSLTRIERPHCSRCTSRMMLARISPGPMGFEHRRFECPKCHFVQNEVVASDPMKSFSVGWLAGELRAPN
jgi:ribosomal protein S27AE